MLGYNIVKELEREYGSSFYLFSVEKLRSNYNKINEAFKKRYENFIIGYSYKTNYLPYLCKELSRLGAYSEVVSRLEYDLAIKIGEDPRNIIFNGPIKTYSDIELALNNESILNIDSNYEIDHLKNYSSKYPNKKIKVGIRVNFDLSENGVSPLQEGYKVSRFGICTENGSFMTVINELKKIKNISIVGLHGHFSTSKRSVETYKRITSGLCKLAKEFILDSLEYIDIGGGIYGEIPESFNLNIPSFDDYAEAICTIINNEFINQNQKPYLILEPGISMVANTFSLFAKVVEIKKVRDINFVLVDASVHNIKPTMHKRNLPMKIVKKETTLLNHNTYNIVGYTCMEKDYLAQEVLGGMPLINDYIVFENVGAYTIVFNPPFIKERPAIIATEDYKNFFVVRKKETLKEFINEDIYCF